LPPRVWDVLTPAEQEDLLDIQNTLSLGDRGAKPAELFEKSTTGYFLKRVYGISRGTLEDLLPVSRKTLICKTRKGLSNT